MSFILSEKRSQNCVEAFRAYREYLSRIRSSLPAVVSELAFSDWHFDPADPRCPHDAWLDLLQIIESGAGERKEKRHVNISIHLLGAYHNGVIVMRYSQVHSYTLGGISKEGHGDWLYDEFRLSNSGNVIHEVEWAGGNRWVIEASDFEFCWHSL